MNQYQQGRQLYEKGEFIAAVQCFQSWVSAQPNDTAALHDLAAALYNTDDLAGAEETVRKALEINDQYAEAWSLLATVQAARGQVGSPLRSVLTATKIEPSNLKYRAQMGTMLLDQHEFDPAYRVFRSIQQVEHNNMAAIAGMATALERQGKLTDAMDCMEPHISTVKSHAGLAIAWGTVCRRLGQYERGVDVLVRMLEAKKAPRVQAMMLAELGALYDKMGQVDAAFTAYTEANRRRQGTWDPQAFEQWVDRTIQSFSTAALQTAKRGSNESDQPIFIVGMPRSGTSLVEQILSAHPNVYGAGELEDLRFTSLVAEARTNTRYPECVDGIDKELLSNLGSWYLSRREQQANGKRWVTDKMPQNFRYVGWASLIMPGARIIHCVRDPMDTMLSCYFQGFKAALAWSNRLDWLGHYYRQYQRLMRHWEQVCPTPIHRVHYETLVTQPEATIHQLLDHCGIPFDPAVLEHQNSTRTIATASYAQANQPIYTSSTGKAARYTTHLRPIQRILGHK